MSTPSQPPEESPAMDGGRPVRATPLPQEWCGAHYYGDEELELVTQVVKSRSPFRYYGFDLQHNVDKLEDAFRSYSGSRYALALSSGTAALQAAMSAMDVGPGDEVILPGYFWVATVGAVVRAGAIPVLADVDDGFSLSPESARSKITPRTKALVVVHMGGMIGRVTELAALAKQHGLYLLEDCAQATGATQGCRKAGTFGDMGIFSFQLNKPMTSGEGGMLITSDPLLHRRACAVHDLGFPRNEAGRLVFDDLSAQLWGIGARMSELTAAAARAQLAKLDRICAHMRQAKYRILDGIADLKHLTPRGTPDPAGDAGSFLMLTLPSRTDSLRFVAALRAEGIVAARDGMYPIHMDDWGLHIYYNIPSLVGKRGFSSVSPWDLSENAASRGVSYEKGACPHLDDLVSRTVLMCVASTLTDGDIADIVFAIRKVAGCLD